MTGKKHIFLFVNHKYFLFYFSKMKLVGTNSSAIISPFDLAFEFEFSL